MRMKLRDKHRAPLVSILQLCLAPFATAVQDTARRALQSETDRSVQLHSSQRTLLEEKDSLHSRVWDWSQGQEEPGKVLVFWAVGSKPKAMSLVRQNIERLRAEEERSWASDTPLHLDIFLAHYDHNKSVWTQTPEDAAWYGKMVQFSAEEYGYKMKLARHRLLDENVTYGPNTTSYEYLWLLDEDADFSIGTSIQALVREARNSQSEIVAPSVIVPSEVATYTGRGSALLQRRSATDDGSHAAARFAEGSAAGCQPGMPLCRFAAPESRCRYRYTNFVEVMFTLIKPRALRAAIAGCPDCLHPVSVWGLDKTWCAITAEGLGISGARVCAIIDGVTVVHENLKTLDKWQGPADELTETGNRKLLQKYHWEMYMTWRLHPRAFQQYPRMLRCIPKEKSNEVAISAPQ